MSRFAAPFRPRQFLFGALATAAALTTAGLFTSPAVASAGEPPAAGLEATVYYNLSDLASARGTLKVYRRIVSAAAEVCPGYDSLRAGAVAESRECQRQAIARAVARIGSPRLAAVHAHAVARRG